MPVRLFVAKLPPNTTESDLREYFSQVGPVSAVILPTDRETGKKRGFAFIDFEDKAIAERAVRDFNNGMFKGQTIHVSEARPREEKRSGTVSRPRNLPGSPRRNTFSGGRAHPAPDRNAQRRGDPGEDQPSRRFRASKSGGRDGSSPKPPRGPIRERRSGRFHDLGEDEQDAGKVEFENLATSAPPDEDNSEQ